MRGQIERFRHAWMIAIFAGVAIAKPTLSNNNVHLGVGSAQAASDDEDDEETDDEDDDSGDDEDDDSDEEDEDADEDQPAVTSGGLFTLKTYPTRELFRPLTLSEGIREARVGLGFDISAQTAFESVGVLAKLHIGMRDNVELQFDFDSSYNFKAFSLSAGVEAALAYDLIDFRAGVRVSRPPAITANGIEGGDFAAAIDIGFPFRYAAKPEIGIIALDTLIAIDLDGSKPDLAPSVGIVTNPIEQVALTVQAQIVIQDFNTDADSFRIPVSATIAFAPTNKIDIGMVFTFPNLKPADPDGDGAAEAPKFYDNRFLSFFAQTRF